MFLCFVNQFQLTRESFQLVGLVGCRETMCVWRSIASERAPSCYLQMVLSSTIRRKKLARAAWRSGAVAPKKDTIIVEIVEEGIAPNIRVSPVIFVCSGNPRDFDGYFFDP